ncbi:hypothetical protein [Colwellia psychrerythraea]|uniref:STAS/SEC14 domain-containing protein n=1 Tax=Colwellia psychrerythraea TaxID=28229 RepID=A0A099KYG3_COLPS|nr:hypothetical protein [Colwellia psychrerythraea]KGJ94912.1 hypothetical protein GAB14E_2146 [Colwellia psychrerythraea]
MAINFPAHGKININIEDNIIILECEGPWNLEFFHILHQDLYNAVKQIAYSKYAVLLIPIGEAIGTAETMDYHINFLKKGQATAVAVNLSRSEVPSTTEHICRISYQAVNLKHEFFLDNDTAKRWLKEQLS